MRWPSRCCSSGNIDVEGWLYMAAECPVHPRSPSLSFGLISMHLGVWISRDEVGLLVVVGLVGA